MSCINSPEKSLSILKAGNLVYLQMRNLTRFSLSRTKSRNAWRTLYSAQYCSRRGENATNCSSVSRRKSALRTVQERRWYAKNVARGHGTFTRRRSRGEKKCRKNARARETGACAYNRSGIINRNLLGINLASVARIPLLQVGARTHARTPSNK